MDRVPLGGVAGGECTAFTGMGRIGQLADTIEVRQFVFASVARGGIGTPEATRRLARTQKATELPLRNSSARCDSFGTPGRLEPLSEPSADGVCPQNATAL